MKSKGAPWFLEKLVACALQKTSIHSMRAFLECANSVHECKVDTSGIPTFDVQIMN